MEKMELSLDDIIRTSKITRGPHKKFSAPRSAPPMKRAQPQKRTVVDARLKIIEKNRSKIHDARDKLIEITRSNVRDARDLLSAKKPIARKPRLHQPHNGEIMSLRKTINLTRMKDRQIYRPPAMKVNRLPDVIATPRGYIDYDDMERLEQEEFAAATRLSRTVQNDVEPMEPRRINAWGAPSAEHFDPFDVYEIPATRRERRHSMEMADMSPPPPPVSAPKSILRRTVREDNKSPFTRRFAVDSGPPAAVSHLSHEMRSRLEQAPDPHASMGIFANSKEPSPPSSLSGHRIVVSNLHPNVSQTDVHELFEDIGPLYESRIVRPGVAEVVYKSLSDAESAVEIYHNRQLDGQPMKCLLVNTRASNKPTAPALRSVGSTKRSSEKGVDIDIDALHKVLFRRN